MTGTPERFGCAACYGDDEHATWQHFRNNCPRDRNLVEDSHFIVGLLHCGQCDQRFVSVFTEFIDWTAGEDPQYTTIMPLTESEATALLDGSLQVHAIGDLGANRQHLHHDWPSGTPPQLSWGRGRFPIVEGR
ncbi:hypothetical protein [Nocardia pseudobrasiliensis]|uniref:Uncharacterized protein n=1 Tax=Nocardia pseudobrasiliensis TaxID=45979 RepID=A0A370I9K0_9NOCA|nr:hypothetical protein [Nocardia pseudobrasiliensis]RDI67383.1 hypothetical protein DFR76_103454 [Nocardia pseudobrasiliensis]